MSRLLAPDGRLVLVEGLWWTGAGLSSADVRELVLRHRSEADVIPMDDPVFWGAPMNDERDVVMSRR